MLGTVRSETWYTWDGFPARTPQDFRNYQTIKIFWDNHTPKSLFTMSIPPRQIIAIIAIFRLSSLATDISTYQVTQHGAQSLLCIACIVFTLTVPGFRVCYR